MVDEHGNDVREAPPSTPVEVMGWKDVPSAGDEILQADSEVKINQSILFYVMIY